MACFRPLKGYRSNCVNENGKRPIVFTPREGYLDMPLDIPCGSCIGCRLERSRQWAIRCVHEASLYEKNCFITLTYNNDHLPHDKSLNVKHFQDFMKRLRWKYGAGIRFFHCGEYGEELNRPHYHACIFNFDFPDKTLWKNERDVKLYRSKSLEDLWENKGYCTIGDVTFESAAYVARYITKKITGEIADDHYKGRKPEYITMSRRPGIGKGWFQKFKNDVFPSDQVVIRGKEMKPPKFYEKLFELDSPENFATVKGKRKIEIRKLDGVDPRLSVREEIQTLKFRELHRGYEKNDT